MMQIAPLPLNESARLEALHHYAILDTPPEIAFDDFTHLASQICATPIALVSLVDAGRQWFKSKVGLEATETPRELAFCAHAILGNEILEVSNALADERFRDNPLVAGAPDIRFYAGIPLTTADGFNLGTLCVIDRVPRHLTDSQRDALVRLGRQVVAQMELRAAWRQQGELTQQLESSQRDLIDFAQNSNVPLHWVDGTGKIIWANCAELDLLGYTADEYIGQPIAKFHADAPVIADILEQLTQGKNLKGCEARLVAKDGSIKIVSISSSVYFENGKFKHTRCFSPDITAQKSHDRLAAHLAAIVNSSSDAIISKTLDGIVTSWNFAAQRLMGYTASEMLGSPITRLFPPDRLDEAGDILAKIKAGQVVNHFETVRLKKDGSPVAVSVTISPIRDRTGTIIGASKILRDITENKRAAEKLQKLNESLQDQNQIIEAANQELVNFAHIVAHDLKAPLRHISFLSQLLCERFADKLGPEGCNQLDLLSGRVKHLNALVDGILSYSKAGRTAAARSSVLLAEVVSRSIDLLGVPPHITVTVETDLPTIEIEPVKAEQVFQNLLSNAFKFMDKPVGKVGVRCQSENVFWHFAVADNGRGIEKQHFNRIFGLFQTLLPRSEIDSTGVGLAVVKKIVEAEGGRIWVESTVGSGATFHFTIPKRPRQSSPEIHP